MAKKIVESDNVGMKEKLLLINFWFVVVLMTNVICDVAMAIDFRESITTHTDGNFSGYVERRPARKIAQEKKEKTPPKEQGPAIVEDKKSEPSGVFGMLNFSVMPSRLTVNGKQRMNGSKGTLNSEMYPTLRVAYLQAVGKWRFLLTGAYKRVTFEQSRDRTVLSPTQTIHNYDLQVARAFGDFSFGFGVGREDRILYRAVSDESIFVEKRIEDRIWLSTQYDLFKNVDSSVSMVLRAGMNPAVNTEVYDIQRGYFGSAFFKVDHRVTSSTRLGLEVVYKYNDYSTRELELKAVETGIGLSFSFEIGAWK